MTCPHSRADWRGCPHCLGINEASNATTDSPIYVITVSNTSGQHYEQAKPKADPPWKRGRPWWEKRSRP